MQKFLSLWLGLMKRFLILFLLFSSPLFAEEYTINTKERPSFQISGIIDDNKTFYYFTNAYEPKCYIVARGCFMKTNVKAEIISKDIIKVGSSYYCSQDYIQARNKAEPKPARARSGGYIDYG